MKLLYDLGIHLIALGSLFRRKSRPQFLRRLGLGFPRIDKGTRTLIWIHAVSVGETRAIAPLVKRLKTKKNPPLIPLSTVTKTGHEEGKRVLPEADWHTFLPFDLRYLIKPLVRRTAPDLVLLSETDFWKHFQTAAKSRGARIALINGKVSERSFKRLSKVPSFAKSLFEPLDHICAQGEIYSDRFIKLGILKQKITVTGNLKLEGFLAEEPLDLGLSSEDIAITLGSTHEPEETLCLNALIPLLERFPTLKILIVPRHPERFEGVAALLEKTAFPFSHFTKLKAGSRLILIDAMGHLRACYKQSILAFVGGSFVSKIGGHNILEPAFFGIPALYGPHMHAQPDLRDLCHQYQAGIEVTPDTLQNTVEELLLNPTKRLSLGKNGLRLIQESKGALQKTYDTICCLLEMK